MTGAVPVFLAVRKVIGRLRGWSVMSVLADTDVDRMTEVYLVCRDENVSL